MLQQFGHPLIDGVKEQPEEGGLQILLQPEVEHHVERVAALLAGDVGDIAIGQPGVLAQGRYGDDDALPVALKHRAGARLAQILAETLAEPGIAEHRFQLLGRIRLDRLEGFVAVERIGAFEREIERQGLTGQLDMDLVAACLGGGAGLEHLDRPARVLLVVERQCRAHKDAPAVAPGDLRHLGDRALTR